MKQRTLIIGTDFQSAQDLKTQGTFLKEALENCSIPVKIVSRHKNYLLRVIDTLFQLLILRKNDIIIIQVFSTRAIYLEYLSALLGKLKGCYIISTLHGGNIPNQYHHNRTKRKFLDLIFKYSDQVTAPSRYIPEQIPAIKDRSIVIKNIIELDHYQTHSKPADEKIRIFWMRAYHPTYDPMKAVQVAECLLDQGHDMELIMAGSDLGLKKDLLHYINSRPCSTKIKLLDVINNTQKNELAAISTVYLCTNIIDNAPVTFLEMMAMGIPIVSTNIGGIPYYVTDNKTALLSTDNSAENIASLIIKLHQNKELRAKIITNGFSFIEEFSMNIVSQKWVSLINQSLNRTN